MSNTRATESLYLIGSSMTQFGRHLETSLKELTETAVSSALKDACVLPDAVDGVFFGNCVQGYMEGQSMIRGQVALRDLGLNGVPIVNVENACATGATALAMAASFIRSGQGDIAIAVGAEKMFSSDKAKMFGAFEGAWDVHNQEQTLAELEPMLNSIQPPRGSRSERPYSVFMDVYAAFARQHMSLFGSTFEDFAAVSAKNHTHSQFNPLSQYRDPYSVDDVLKSAPIVYPLTLPMCAPISDGAAAVVISNERGLGSCKSVVDLVKLRACVIQTSTDRSPADYEKHVSRRAADLAYKAARLSPNDIDVAEVHDATAPGEVIEVEALRLVEPGQGGRAAIEGRTALGGDIPVNVSGGLQSKGHPIGATGLGQICELHDQLRGRAGQRQVRDAKYAIAQNGGGVRGVEEAVSVVTILEAPN